MRSTSRRPVDSETPSGRIDGANATFRLTFTPIAGSVHLSKRGLRMMTGVGNDYTISGVESPSCSDPSCWHEGPGWSLRDGRAFVYLAVTS